MVYTFPALSFFLCLLFTPIVRRIVIKKEWIAYPAKERWHKKPTALLGGIAIYLSMSIPLLLASDFSALLSQDIFTSGQRQLPPIGTVSWLGITFLFILGLLDDFIHIKPHSKLVGQILVASLVALLGFRLQWFTSLTLDTMVTIVWIVGITNAFNLLDNMDGLCAGVGLIAALCFVWLYMGIVPQGALMAMVLAGALAAFLIYNFHPASIFMGDCGSLLIGFTLSLLTLSYPGKIAPNTLSLYAIPVMILMVPILDTSMVTLIRILSGRKASVGGKDHTSHRLVLMGMGEKGAVLFLCGTGAVSGMAAVFVNQSDTLTSPVVIIPVALSILLMGVYLAQLRVYPEKEFSLLREKRFTPILVELTYKHQIMLVILDFGLIAFAYYLSYRLRFDARSFQIYFKVFLQSLPAVIACKMIAFFIFGIYRGIWRYMSSNDVFVYLKASFLATLLSVVAVTFIYRFEDFSKGIFIIDWFLITGLLLGTRGSFRIFHDTMKRKNLDGEKILIYGAGRGGEILLREILNNEKLEIKPIGFIDDDPLKIGKKLQGYPILGGVEKLASLIKKNDINGLLVSFTNRDSENFESIKSFCRAKGLFLKQFFIHVDDVDLES